MHVRAQRTACGARELTNLKRDGVVVVIGIVFVIVMGFLLGIFILSVGATRRLELLLQG
jgi:hypothetical protein